MTQCELNDIFRIKRRPHLAPDRLHFRSENDFPSDALVAPSLWQELFFGCMRKRQMANIMTKGCHSNNAPPIRTLVRVVNFWNQVANGIRYMFTICDYVEHASR